jgi:high-affinity K+ transport system ATPase subunit B
VGDRISADMCLTKVDGLSIDTSTLTGESVPTTPQPGETIFAGTFAVEGEALGVVTATGNSTRLARIAQMTAAGWRPPSPLALELDRVVRVIALVSVAVGSVFLVIALLVGIQLADGFLFALGVTVALVPEGLLPTVTLSLAMGAQRMAARGALVRRLESVETLGSTTFICTDKTSVPIRPERSLRTKCQWSKHGRQGAEYLSRVRVMTRHARFLRSRPCCLSSGNSLPRRRCIQTARLSYTKDAGQPRAILWT